MECWGSNSVGELGDGSQQTQPQPVRVPLQEVEVVVAGGDHTCAITEHGSVHCWGANTWGQAGAPPLEVGFRTTPQFVEGLPGRATGLAAGEAHMCALLGEQVACWGANHSGQVGEPLDDQHFVPVPMDELSARQVAAGGRHTCVVRRDRHVSCWGENWGGQLGCAPDFEDGPHVWFPTEVEGLADVSELALGSDHTCARKRDGTVWCWGMNGHKQLGTDEVEAAEHVPGRVEGLQGVVALAAGTSHTCAIEATQRLLCWGANGYGQLGTGRGEDQASPTLVPDLERVVAVRAGMGHTCALDADDAVHC